MVNSDVPQMKQVKIWDVLSGPYPCDLPDDIDVHYNLCKVEIEGKIIHMSYKTFSMSSFTSSELFSFPNSNM